MDQEQFNFHELTDDDIALINRHEKIRSSMVFKLSKALVFKMRRVVAYLTRASNASKRLYRIIKGGDDIRPNAEKELHIYYRHVHVKADNTSRFPSKHRPAWFSHEICFRNLVNTIRLDPLAHRVKIIVVFDGTPEDFKSDFISAYCANASLGIDVQFVRSRSSLDSFMIMLGMVRNAQMPGSDLIYLLENDYLHQVGWVSKMFELYESGLQFDFLSLYDHPDLYNLPKHANLTTRLVHSQSHHWRTAPSTCASFILDKRAFNRDCEIFRSCLADHHLFAKLVGRRGRVLLTPVPGLSTHSMADYLSPTIDWGKLAQSNLNESELNNRTETCA